MEIAEFIHQIWDLAPSIEEFSKIGIDKASSESIIEGYIATPNGKSVSSEEPLIEFVCNYDVSKFELNGFTFFSEVEEDDRYYYIGKYHGDEFVVIKATKEVAIVDYTDLNNVMSCCAANGKKFFDAMVVAAAYLTKCMFDDDYLENRDMIEATAQECADRSGGGKYLNFYRNILG